MTDEPVNAMSPIYAAERVPRLLTDVALSVVEIDSILGKIGDLFGTAMAAPFARTMADVSNRLNDARRTSSAAASDFREGVEQNRRLIERAHAQQDELRRLRDELDGVERLLDEVRGNATVLADGLQLFAAFAEGAQGPRRPLSERELDAIARHATHVGAVGEADEVVDAEIVDEAF